MVFSAKKRGNPFAARSRQRRAQSASAAEQPRTAPKPKPKPNPEPEPEELPVELDESSGEQPLPDADDTERTAPATRFARDSDVKHAEDTPDVATIAISDEKPLGDLIEVAARAREKLAAALDVPVDATTPLEEREKRAASASTRVENGAMAIDIPASLEEVRNIAEVVKAKTEPEHAHKRGRGRPRPQETIDRDNAVLGVLKSNPAGVSKAQLARVLSEKEQQVYSSLRQLSKEGRAQTHHVKDVGYRWFAA